MGINKKQVIYTEKFDAFKSDELNKAKECILKDIDELEQAGLKVKQIPVDFEHYILINERSPLMYDGILPTIIEALSRKRTGKKPIRLEKDGRIYAIELHIKALTANGKNTEKIIRYFVFKYTQSQKTYVVKKCSNAIYNIYVFLLKKAVNKRRKEYAFRERAYELLLRCCFPSRFGQQAYTFRGKDYTAIVFLLIFLLAFMFVIFFTIAQMLN